MFDAFSGRLPRNHFVRRLFIAGPLECVDFYEVRKFFETEANRFETPTEIENGRCKITFENPNLRGRLESDVVDALNNFRHRQFIYVKYNKSAVTGRLINYFDRLI